jgi:hypothetical protein
MCANRQTADDAILYKAVVTRTVKLLFRSGREGETPLALKSSSKPEDSLGRFERFEQFDWI